MSDETETNIVPLRPPQGETSTETWAETLPATVTLTRAELVVVIKQTAAAAVEVATAACRDERDALVKRAERAEYKVQQFEEGLRVMAEFTRKQREDEGQKSRRHWG